MGDDTNPNSVIEEIMETPEKLRDLDLDAFAEELERQVSSSFSCSFPKEKNYFSLGRSLFVYTV